MATFSGGERLILLMLAEIYKKQKIAGEFDPDFLISALSSGHDWAVQEHYRGIFDRTPHREEDVRETHEILTMFRALEGTVAKLSKDDQTRIDAACSPFTTKDLHFQGFDGNNDEHYSIASFIVNSLGQYPERKGGVMNSHSSGSLGAYKRMLAPFYRHIANAHDGLTVDALIDILQERRHPSAR
jgi:uncharacterized protein YfbU (UPF0304 family)